MHACRMVWYALLVSRESPIRPLAFTPGCGANKQAARAVTLKRQQGNLNAEETECCSYYYYYCHAT